MKFNYSAFESSFSFRCCCGCCAKCQTTQRWTHTRTHTHTNRVSNTHRELSWTNRYTHTICTHTHRETLTKSIGSSCDGNWDGDCDWERDCDWDCDFDWSRDSSWDYIESSGGSRWTVLVARLFQTDGRSWRKAAKRPQHILKDVRLSGQPECHLSHERQRERESATNRERARARESVRERAGEFTRTQGFYQWAAHVPKINACDFIFIPDSLPAPSSEAGTGCSPAIVAALSEI